MKAMDLSGMRVGRLLVLDRAYKKNGKWYWRCLCDCGTECYRYAYRLTHGLTTSCGCYGIERMKESVTKHGQRHTRLYKIWEAMKRRCDSPKCDRYPNYGGRGIKYCNQWVEFIPFYEWAIQHGYDDSLSIDRIDPNGNYEPKNCRWVPILDQANNKTTNRFVVYAGRRMTISEISRKTNIPYERIYQRIAKLGWSVKKAVEAG